MHARILRVLSWVIAAGAVLALLGWAFAAYRHPDRVGDFASFVQRCVTVLAR